MREGINGYKLVFTELNVSSTETVNTLSYSRLAVGGVARWLGCRFFVSGLSMACARSVVDSLVCGKLSTVGQPTQPSIRPGSVNE